MTLRWTGGPARYTEAWGGYEKLLAHHRGLAIAPEQRHRFVSLRSFAADGDGRPDDPDFRSALVAELLSSLVRLSAIGTKATIWRAPAEASHVVHRSAGAAHPSHLRELRVRARGADAALRER